MLTRYPEGLAGALEKLTADARPFPKTSKATAHLFIVQPFRKEGKQARQDKTSVWDTHPPIMERIKRLRSMDSMDGMYNQAMMEARLTQPGGAQQDIHSEVDNVRFCRAHQATGDSRL